MIGWKEDIMLMMADIAVNSIKFKFSRIEKFKHLPCLQQIMNHDYVKTSKGLYFSMGTINIAVSECLGVKIESGKI